jgi:hypothetical protein
MVKNHALTITAIIGMMFLTSTIIISMQIPAKGQIASIAPSNSGNKIPDGSITTSKLADGAVTNPKIAPDAATSEKIQDGQVKTNDIADGAITSSKANFIKFHTIPSGSDGWTPGIGQANMDIAGSDLNDIIESSVFEYSLW